MLTLYLKLLAWLERADAKHGPELSPETLAYVFGYTGVRGHLSRKARSHIYCILNTNYATPKRRARAA